MSELLEEYNQRLVKAFVCQEDDIVKTAITRFLGRSVWTLDELKNRCVRQISQQTRIETFLIDGVPVLELHPPTYGQELKEGGVFLNATRNYRFLIPQSQGENNG